MAIITYAEYTCGVCGEQGRRPAEALFGACPDCWCAALCLLNGIDPAGWGVPEVKIAGVVAAIAARMQA